MSFHVPKHHRYQGVRSSTKADGNNGQFSWPLDATESILCQASDGEGWEHVSVSIHRRSGGTRMPRWSEMCMVKRLFWDAEDAVMQLHPPESTYVNNHPHVLHLWRPIDQPIPLPPRSFV